MRQKFLFLCLFIVLLAGCAALESGIRAESGPGVIFGPLTFESAQNGRLAFFYNPAAEKASLSVSSGASNWRLEQDTPACYHLFRIDRSGPLSVRPVSESAELSGRGASFPSFSSDPFRIVIYGDSRTDYEANRAVCEAIASYSPAIVLHTGDLADNGSDPDTWVKFFESARPVLEKSVFLPAKGNHDRGGAYWEKAFRLDPEASYYSLRLPLLKIVVLDTEAPFGTNSAQYRWLTNELAGAAGLWKIVLEHRPFVTSGPHAADPEMKPLREELLPALKKYNANIVFAGHDHLYERSSDGSVLAVTTGGGGAPFYGTPAENPFRQKLVLNKRHFVVLDITENHIIGRALTPSGEEIDRFEYIE